MLAELKIFLLKLSLKRGVYGCVLNIKFLITKSSPGQDDLSYPYPGYDEYSEEMPTIYSKHNTEAIFKDYSSNLRYILNIYGESGSIQISVFCYCTIFFIHR